MHESSTIDCSECGAETPDDLNLCPQCGAEVDATSVTPTKPARRSGEDGGTQTTEPSTSDRDTNASPAVRTARDGATDDTGGGIGSRFGFAAVVSMAGGAFLLAPVFLADTGVLVAPMILFGGAEMDMLPRSDGVGVLVATTLMMASGVLCLFAAALRLAGIGFDISKAAGALGILSGAVGIVMIFVV